MTCRENEQFVHGWDMTIYDNRFYFDVETVLKRLNTETASIFAGVQPVLVLLCAAFVRCADIVSFGLSVKMITYHDCLEQVHARKFLARAFNCIMLHA
jgi:hypothetical protein